MFLVLGILAIMAALGTVILGMNGKNPERFRFISVSLTALQFVLFTSWMHSMLQEKIGLRCWM